MPQASEELRKEWGGANGVGEDKAESYLLSKGYTLSPGWLWILPSSDHIPTEEETAAMCFLIEEWDYGGYVKNIEELKKYEVARSTVSVGSQEW